MNGIRDVVREEQPRERLLLEGAGSLSNRELLAVLLRTGSKEETVLKLSDKILHQFDGLRMLKDATLEELISIQFLVTQSSSPTISTLPTTLCL